MIKKELTMVEGETNMVKAKINTFQQQSLGSLLLKFSRPLVLIALFIFFSIATDTFWSIDNWSNVKNIVLQQAPFTILLAACMTISIILNGIDLSQGAAVALIICVCGIFLNRSGNAAMAIGIAIGMGAIIGAANGFLIARIGVQPFVATYAMRWIMNGLALVLLGGRQIYDLGPSFRSIFISNEYAFFIIMAIIVLVLSFMMNQMVFGKRIYGIGMNERATRISGIRTTKLTIIAYIITGAIIGLVAIMYLANLGTAEPNIGGNFAINAVAATLVGGTTIGSGNGKISNAVIGALIMLVLTNGMIQIGVPSVWQQFIVGSVIILSIMMERILHKLAAKYEN